MADEEGGADFVALLPDDLRENPSLKDFKDVGSLAKSYIDTKTKLGGMTTVPTDKSSPEDWAKFYNKLGRPETADKYELKLPEMNGQNFSEDALKSFREHAHAAGMTPKQAQANMEWYMDVFQKQVDASAVQLTEAASAAASELRKDWGAEYEGNMGRVDKALSQFFGDDEAKTLRALSASNPKLMKSLAQIGGTISESAGKGNAVNGGTGELTPEEAKAKIKEVQSDHEHPYHDKRKPGHLEAYKEVSDLYKIAYDNVSD